MKNILVLLIFVTNYAFSQGTIVIQPDASTGKDALLHENYPNGNYGSTTEFISYDWSFSGTEALGYSLIEFDLSAVPSGVTITGATLSLYHNPNSPSAGQAGNNACYLKQVTSQWDENIVSWNTMPSTTYINQVYLATSTSATQNYPSIDITSFVTDWYANPQSNYGMMLEIIDKNILNSMKFCSSDYADSLLRPKLIIYYNGAPNPDKCITIHPDAEIGKDALLHELYPNSNYGSTPDFISYDWSFSGTEALGYSLIQFDLYAVPSSVTITGATLSLYHNPTSSSAGQAGNNACYLKKVTSQWDENIVTWNTMPSTTNINQVYLSTSPSATQDYPNIDVTSFVIDWYANPQSNYGMMLEIIDKNLLNSMKFCSSDYVDSILRPKLEICYSESNNIYNNVINDEISIYPNPNDGTFTINLSPNYLNKETTIQIYNSIGELLHNETVEMLSQDFYKTFYLNSAPKGMYLIKIVNSNGAIVQKMIIE